MDRGWMAVGLLYVGIPEPVLKSSIRLIQAYFNRSVKQIEIGFFLYCPPLCFVHLILLVLQRSALFNDRLHTVSILLHLQVEIKGY